jgi:hypothetical protein
MPVDVQVAAGKRVVKGRIAEAKGGVASFSAGMEVRCRRWNDRLARVRDAIRPVNSERHVPRNCMNILIFHKAKLK